MGACCVDYDAPKVWRQKERVARKVHRCCECGGLIRVGETYQSVAMLDDYGWKQYKTCEPCADLRSSLSNVMCVYMQGLAEAYEEYLCHNPHEAGFSITTLKELHERSRHV